VRNVTASVYPGFACRKRSVGPLALFLSSSTKPDSAHFACTSICSLKGFSSLPDSISVEILRGAEFTTILSIVTAQARPCQASRGRSRANRTCPHPSGNRSISRALFLLFRSFAETTNVESPAALATPHNRVPSSQSASGESIDHSL
jgi:hypothetical protein